MELKEIIVMLVARALALLMGFDPKFFVRDPRRRTKTFLKSVESIGKAVAIVLIVGFAVMIYKARM